MDISYWIFILIAYLVSQWFKRRFRRPVPDEVEPQELPRNQEIPEWLRNLGFDEFIKEADEKEEVEELFEQLDEEAEEAVELQEPIEVVEEEPLSQPEQPPDQGEGPRTEPLWKREWKRASAPTVKRNVAHPILQYFNSPQNLQKIILMREILGSPRARQRHRYRPFY
tara:strand:- start:448 stop:951 length:504 start_codon:yes stop_codon:yes gene_type:complete